MGVHVFPILNPLPPPSTSHPSGLSQCTSPDHTVSCIKPGLVICFTYDNIHVSLLFTASDLVSITSHIHNWVLFSLWLCLFILSGVISPLISSNIFEDLPTWGVHLSVSYLFAFSYVLWDSQGKNTEVVCHSHLQWTTFCQKSPP